MGLLEDWVSGLNQRFTKPSARKKAREFESHILREELRDERRIEKHLRAFRGRFEKLFLIHWKWMEKVY